MVTIDKSWFNDRLGFYVYAVAYEQFNISIYIGCLMLNMSLDSRGGVYSLCLSAYKDI